MALSIISLMVFFPASGTGATMNMVVTPWKTELGFIVMSSARLKGAAEKITPEIVNFMIKYGRGLVCTPVTEKTAKRLKLKVLNRNDSVNNLRCKFTTSVDLIKGSSTGISAYDRARTIKALSNNQSKFGDFYKPGHVFPILIRKGGVLERAGHSEASIELCKLAGLKPVSVICEIIKDNGKMARIKDLLIFSNHFKIKIVTIADLISFLKDN